MEHFAFKARNQARIEKKKVFTSVRLCDETKLLRLAVRQEKNKPWTYYSREELNGLDASLNKIPVVPENDQ